MDVSKQWMTVSDSIHLMRIRLKTEPERLAEKDKVGLVSNGWMNEREDLTFLSRAECDSKSTNDTIRQLAKVTTDIWLSNKNIVVDDDDNPNNS